MAKKEKKPRILIVEDDPDMVQVYRALLEKNGYEVITANYALPALFSVVRKPPDLILADLHMPHMNGLELIDQFMDHHDTRDIPIVVVTGSDARENRDAAFKAGCAGYITKPVDPRSFLEQIGKFLRHPNERKHEHPRRRR
jgi:two-component system cell cycle response regulator/two-component system cell cycle response regulator DivK